MTACYISAPGNVLRTCRTAGYLGRVVAFGLCHFQEARENLVLGLGAPDGTSVKDTTCRVEINIQQDLVLTNVADLRHASVQHFHRHDGAILI
eukprot:3053275-Rhodomonas_salina.1